MNTVPLHTYKGVIAVYRVCRRMDSEDTAWITALLAHAPFNPVPWSLLPPKASRPYVQALGFDTIAVFCDKVPTDTVATVLEGAASCPGLATLWLSTATHRLVTYSPAVFKSRPTTPWSCAGSVATPGIQSASVSTLVLEVAVDQGVELLSTLFPAVCHLQTIDQTVLEHLALWPLLCRLTLCYVPHCDGPQFDNITGLDLSAALSAVDLADCVAGCRQLQWLNCPAITVRTGATPLLHRFATNTTVAGHCCRWRSWPTRSAVARRCRQ